MLRKNHWSPTGKCFSQNVASPSESKDSHSPQGTVFEKFVSHQQKGGGLYVPPDTHTGAAVRNVSFSENLRTY